MRQPSFDGGGEDLRLRTQIFLRLKGAQCDDPDNL